ncbi:MAG: MarR family transcriptional regulator [Comamonadaceae bacterium]|jgi:DNA-binding MarR family transcriptional regulator|uniref:MarR family transcriptional regulator n=1 Tax=Hydrogenophaga borbori TaxID=2294117 RepID=A0A372EG68_9BURK|nr:MULTISPECIES: MarR family transcriptional regulator [Hydrogenophaga]NCT97472.1 MarR family transcriptional regulator [Comamonadaceae bacterium]RFP77395.1 MarR family transcriptional regulator [Hydrogenophaga borbori]WQB83314.1 MarR family transcriptional regulator [Hydrogenophaga sp. SNF1]
MATSVKKAATDQSKKKREVLNLAHYVTYFFTVLANKLSSGASRLYLKRFGIGIIEWRVMAMVAIEPDIAPARITQIIGLDKASVSRESRRLEEKGYLAVAEDPSNQRRKLLSLTPLGYELHDRIIQVALERERRLLSDLSPDEVETLVDLLQRTTAKIPHVNEFDPGSTAAATTKPRHRKNTMMR